MERVRRLPCKLTRDERAEFADRNANHVQELRQIEGEKKEANAHFKSRIDDKKSEIYECADAATTGIQWREVSVYETVDRSKGIAETMRSDTGEVIETRHLTPSELQTAMDL